MTAPTECGGWGKSLDEIGRMTLYQLNNLTREFRRLSSPDKKLTDSEVSELVKKQSEKRLQRQREEQRKQREKFTGNAN